MIHLRLRPEKMLLTLFISIVPSHLIAVFLGIKQRDEMNAGPDLLAGNFATRSVSLLASVGGRTGREGTGGRTFAHAFQGNTCTSRSS